jgi:hypothetical protein
MDANKSNIELIQFITFVKSARRRSSTAAQLRHENAALLQIIADFDAQLAMVEAERDELQRKIDGYQHTAKMCGIHNMSIAKRAVI